MGRGCQAWSYFLIWNYPHSFFILSIWFYLSNYGTQLDVKAQECWQNRGNLMWFVWALTYHETVHSLFKVYIQLWHVSICCSRSAKLKTPQRRTANIQSDIDFTQAIRGNAQAALVAGLESCGSLRRTNKQPLPGDAHPLFPCRSFWRQAPIYRAPR